MVDVVSPEVRSRMMAGIRNRNTKPELLLRRLLHKKGFRYRLHSGSVPGHPDMVFPKHGAVLFAHGCFWHGHHCHLFRWPTTRSEFWKEKIGRNRARDVIVRRQLKKSGWRVLTVWECALKGRARISTNDLVKRCASWLRSTRAIGEIEGKTL